MEQGRVVAEEKPLHVRVAEKLGCRPAPYRIGEQVVKWDCTCQPHRIHGTEGTDGYVFTDLEHYDTNWSAAGPLLERFKLLLHYTDYNNEGWIADVVGSPAGSGVIAGSPCEAIAMWVARYGKEYI